MKRNRQAAAQRTRSNAALALALLFAAVGACGSKEHGSRESPDDAAAEVSFDEARANAALRPGYLAQVVERAGPRIPDYLGAVQYMTEAELAKLHPRGHVEAGAAPAFATLDEKPTKHPPFITNRRSKIIVLPPAFDAPHTENEIVFLLGLLDHELVHVHQAMRGLPQEELSEEFLRWLDPAVAESLFDTVSELLAYQNEIAASRSCSLPASYYQDAYGAYLTYYLRLFEDGLVIPKPLRHQLMIGLFADWMRKQDKLFFADEDRWGFQTPTARYELPPAVVRAIRARGDND